MIKDKLENLSVKLSLKYFATELMADISYYRETKLDDV